MKTRAIVTAILAAGAVAACSGGAQPVPQPIPQPGAVTGAPLHELTALPKRADPSLHSNANVALVYVSDDAKDFIAAFNRDGTRAGTITDGLNYPQGLYVDGSHDLWVANRGASNVLEFARGGSSPIATLQDGGEQPEGVTVCPDGTIYVANIMANSGGGGNVLAYAPGRTIPTRTLNYQGGYFFYPACDAHGNLFVSLVLGTGGAVVEFPRGHQSGAKLLPISWGGNPGGITIDNAGNLLANFPGPTGAVVEYTENGTPTGLVIHTKGFGNTIDLNRRGNLLFAAAAHGALSVTFPGGARRHSYRSQDFVQPIGVAVDPARY